MPSTRSKAGPRSPKGSRSPLWSHEEDDRLMNARKEGRTWHAVADLFPDKSDTACRKRHDRIMDKLRAEELGGPRLNDLAQAYQETRKEMWSILGNRLGEDWETVEEKCMEKGIKTLRSAANAARRSANACSEDGKDNTPDTQCYYEQRPMLHGPTIASLLAPPIPRSHEYDFMRGRL